MKKIYTTLVAIFALIQFSYAQWAFSGADIYNNNTGQVNVGTVLTAASGLYSHTWTAVIAPGSYVNVMSIPAGHYGVAVRGILSIYSTFAGSVTQATYSVSIMGEGLSSSISLSSFGQYYGGTAPFNLIESGSTALGGGSNMVNLYNGSGSTETVFYTLTLDGNSSIPTYYNNPTAISGIPVGHTVVFGSINAAIEAAGIYSSGNVGIGTKTPDAKLAVKGTIHTQEVKVDMTGWSDFVFDKTYALPTLSYVKSYIGQNHHLPEMPAEADVMKNGINLGEMVKLQMKKIEELTLYAIDQKEEIQMLAKENKQLKEQQKQQNKQQEDRITALEAAITKLTIDK
ncbi:tail fiber protein [Mucilaginibacter sp. UR6-11]|uniref:tail fiber protein n=1 Tax=Mucilaginibacter sp. UR6-11 TaxID=1435644 RepID=UPI001E4E4DFE|nr:tail fiber protein [Mucilaginibacter sp. UR6-11]MCC8427252.1 tail fiber protein [Mucilaginibacter sp. UR6-11]